MPESPLALIIWVFWLLPYDFYLISLGYSLIIPIYYKLYNRCKCTLTDQKLSENKNKNSKNISNDVRNSREQVVLKFINIQK